MTTQLTPLNNYLSNCIITSRCTKVETQTWIQLLSLLKQLRCSLIIKVDFFFENATTKPYFLVGDNSTLGKLYEINYVGVECMLHHQTKKKNENLITIFLFSPMIKMGFIL
jgi:hypothetical protein